MKTGKTLRGFNYTKFKDQYGLECSLQKSSNASENCIWFGINKPKLTVFENKDMGKYIITEMPETFMVDSRMHLTQDQVKELLPFLTKFAKTGNL